MITQCGDVAEMWLSSILSEVEQDPEHSFQTTTAIISDHTHPDSHTQVKHCWRLMEAVIEAEVSTDTCDP